MVPWLLRISFAMCFIGHGAFGLLQKRDWLLFFSSFGIGENAALTLMPVVGTVDIALGIAALFGAPRAVILYGAAWCLFTAALRPLTGLSFGEFFERAGNFGVPIALLAWTAGQSWLTRVGTSQMLSDRAAMVRTVCIGTTAMLLFGHGWLALESKPLLVSHLSLLGFGSGTAPIMGLAEIALAAVCVWRPSVGLLVGIAAWKIASESLFVFGGAPIWEFVERGGSYAAPLAAAALTSRRRIVIAPVVRWSTAATLATVAAGAATLSAQAPAPLTPDLIAALRSGGYVVACRHAITSHDREDRMPVNFDDPSTQRVLSPEGEQQAIAIGRSLAALNIRFGRVLASPFQRTRKSAESMAGAVEIDEALSSMTRGKDTELRALLSGPVDGGANRLVVTHQGLLYRVFRSVKMGSIAEGDCLVVKPNGEGGDVLALLKPADWAAAAAR
jgi:phosphohistidine phosphatase SixA